jgi:hypothetical protein
MVSEDEGLRTIKMAATNVIHTIAGFSRCTKTRPRSLTMLSLLYTPDVRRRSCTKVRLVAAGLAVNATGSCVTDCVLASAFSWTAHTSCFVAAPLVSSLRNWVSGMKSNEQTNPNSCKGSNTTNKLRAPRTSNMWPAQMATKDARHAVVSTSREVRMPRWCRKNMSPMAATASDS